MNNLKLGRILLVEDDPRDVELTVQALDEYNLANEVVVARDGVEAVEYLFRRGEFMHRAGNNPAVVLLDLKMPRMDGIQVLKQMKADESLKKVPVVVLTSSGETRDVEECYKLGVNAYVVKPVEFSKFMEAVKHLSVFWAIVNEPPSGSTKKPR